MPIERKRGRRKHNICNVIDLLLEVGLLTFKPLVVVTVNKRILKINIEFDSQSGSLHLKS